MPSEVETTRELARAFWDKREIVCPKHPGGRMQGEFVKTTYADHLVLTCDRGKESLSIPQRPRQQQFNLPQIEGLIISLRRGDNILCYRCQSKLEIGLEEQAASGTSTYEFTCVRCLSWGFWQGNPALISTEAAVG